MSKMVRCFVDSQNDRLIICIDSEISQDLLSQYFARGFDVRWNNKTLDEFAEWYKREGYGK